MKPVFSVAWRSAPSGCARRLERLPQRSTRCRVRMRFEPVRPRSAVAPLRWPAHGALHGRRPAFRRPVGAGDRGRAAWSRSAIRAVVVRFAAGAERRRAGDCATLPPGRVDPTAKLGAIAKRIAARSVGRGWWVGVRTAPRAVALRSGFHALHRAPTGVDGATIAGRRPASPTMIRWVRGGMATRRRSTEDGRARQSPSGPANPTRALPDGRLAAARAASLSSTGFRMGLRSVGRRTTAPLIALAAWPARQCRRQSQPSPCRRRERGCGS